MSEKLVKVEKYGNVSEAELARVHLEAAGIPAFLANAQMVTTEWILGNAIGYILLEVPEDHAAAAVEVLDEFRAHHKLTVSQESLAPGETDCLQCGAVFEPGTSTCASCGWSYLGTEEVSPNDDHTPHPAADNEATKHQEMTEAELATRYAPDGPRSPKQNLIFVYSILIGGNIICAAILYFLR